VPAPNPPAEPVGWPPTGPSAEPPPAVVRAAAGVVCVQGALSAAFAVVLLLGPSREAQQLIDVLGEAAFFLVLAAGVLAVGVALLRGYRWARTPALVLQILLLGVAWYTIGPSGRPGYGVPVGLVSLATAVALLGAKARAWAYDQHD
jgi:hypothetical protein